jgi:hypothetical protein
MKVVGVGWMGPFIEEREGEIKRETSDTDAGGGTGMENGVDRQCVVMQQARLQCGERSLMVVVVVWWW